MELSLRNDVGLCFINVGIFTGDLFVVVVVVVLCLGGDNLEEMVCFSIFGD